MTGEWSDDLKARVRAFLADRGAALRLDQFGLHSPYGWQHWEAQNHIGNGCHWVIEEGARLSEQSYSMFQGTFVDNEDEVGLNVTPASCACGEYTEVTLRWIGSLADLMQTITNSPNDPEVIL